MYGVERVSTPRLPQEPDEVYPLLAITRPLAPAVVVAATA